MVEFVRILLENEVGPSHFLPTKYFMADNPRTFSLFLPEESPICDLKMDISGSCSSESPANTSPDVKPLSRAPCYLESDPDDGLRILKSPSDLEMAKSRTVHAIHPSLDNRPQAAQLISVHSHPLMSPEPSTDNESTNHFFAQDFKDIPLRLANPLGGSNRTLTPSPKRHVRLGQLDKDSASAVSSDSEADLSQYQANVGPSFQTVSLVAKPTTSLAKQKKSKFSSCSNIDEDSADERLRARQGSVESLSVRSFDDMDALSHLMSRSSSTSLIEDGATTTVRLGEASINGDPRPGRNSHTMILPDGTAREIDMKVIEPYKRVLSHGGYLKDDCQNAIVIFSCCFLPDRSRADYRYVMDSLFLCVISSSSTKADICQLICTF